MRYVMYSTSGFADNVSESNVYVSSCSPGGGISRTSDDVTTLLGRDHKVAPPGEKFAVSDCTLLTVARIKQHHRYSDRVRQRRCASSIFNN